MKTLLIGNFGAQNIGDELILSSALEDYPDCIVMTADSEYSQNFTEKKFETVPFVPIGVRSWLKFIFSSAYRDQIFSLNKKCVQVVFPGGGLFAIKFRACLLWFFIFLWIRFLLPDKKIIFQHQGVDKNLSWLSRKMTAFVFSRTDEISVRDEASREAVRDLCGKDVPNTHDRVERYLSTYFQHSEAQKETMVLVNSKRRWRSGALKEQFPHHKKIFIALHKKDLRFVSDSSFFDDVVFPRNKTALLNLFQRSSFVVGMRFHSLLLGYHFCSNDKTFVLGAPYSEKVKNFVAEKGISQISS
ncbi:polysaccharide pyruvyl transferase family protein [Candidatus Gracilibacteria bacterium]|nr:polysaccharide pyruvyl transferase family protein [Candidatus Gracilibacteria bacterium]MCF7819478.1 polysaccharide pyruvyl transferase family protein [Candidatus Gracilibacteria bacterium]